MTRTMDSNRTRNANGQGSFSKLEDGRIRMRKQHGFLDNGRPRVLTVTGKTESECIKRMVRKVAEFEEEKITSQNLMKMTLEGMCVKHLEYDIANNARLKPTSADRREVTIRNQISTSRIGQRQVGSLTEIDINDYINSLLFAKELSVSSIKKVFYVISGAYKWAVRRRYISENPCDIIKDELMSTFNVLEQRGVNDIRVQTLNESQIEQLIRISEMKNANNHVIKYPASVYILFLLNTGMRIGELCCLRWKDVIRTEDRVLIRICKTRHVSIDRKDNIRVTSEDVTKNSKARTIELNEDAIRYLDIIEAMNGKTDDNGYVILSRDSKPTEPTKLIKRINTVYRNACFPEDITGAHILRKTFATKRYKAGESLEMIAAYIGDLPSTVLKHYINEKETLDLGDEGNINYLKKM